jgi:5-methylcytosine-specific restriction endonuclease McrA
MSDNQAREIACLRKIAKRKYKALKERTATIAPDRAPPDLDDMTAIMLDNYRQGFRCHYCGDSLEMFAPFPYRKSASIDHVIPLSAGGTNEAGNLVVACHECNIIKGTMTGETFREMMSRLIIGSPLHRQIFDEMFRGALKKKMDRCASETKQGKPIPEGSPLVAYM